MTTNSILATLHTLMQYNSSDITLTFKDQHNLPCLTVSYVQRQFKIDFCREASILTFEDADSAYVVIEHAISNEENTPPL